MYGAHAQRITLMNILFKLVTPERTVFQEEVVSVTLPTEDGEITVLPGHISLVSKLKPGVAELKRPDGSVDEVAVSGGFIQVLKGSQVTVLADTAERGVELSLEAIEEAKERAEKIMKEKIAAGDMRYADAAAHLERELARYKAATRYARRKGIRTSTHAR